MLTWLAGPSKGLLLIGRREGYLPPWLQKLNKNGIQQNILVAQGVVTTIIALLYAFVPSVSSAYWIFSVMTTQVYLIMYILMFIAAMKLRKKEPNHPRGYLAPALTLLCMVGMLSSAAALLIGFVPPSQAGSTNPGLYFLIVMSGVVIVGLLIPGLFYFLRKPEWKTADVDSEPVQAEAKQEE
jgi:amino acid transporter